MSRNEPKPLAPPLVAVQDVVGVLIVHQGGVEGAELFRHVVHVRHHFRADTVRKAVLFLYLHVYARDVVKDYGQKSDVVSKPHPRALTARLRDPLAYAAVHSPIQRLILYI